MHVVSNVGRDPVAEFCRQADKMFEQLPGLIEDETVRLFEAVAVGPDGVDWEEEGLLGPSATWTYLVSDNPFGANGLQALVNRPGAAAWGAIALGPVVFLWALLLKWRQWKQRQER